MTRFTSLSELQKYQQQLTKAKSTLKRRIVICAGTGCVANGSLKVYAKLAEEIEKKGLPVILSLRFEDEHEKDEQPGTAAAAHGFVFEIFWFLHGGQEGTMPPFGGAIA